MSQYLLVRVGEVRYGIPASNVREIGSPSRVLSAPTSLEAVRGVTPVREKLVSLVHLGALIASSKPPAELGATLILAECGGRPVAFEVDEADDLIKGESHPVPHGREIPWACGMVRQGDTLIPIIDLDALGERLGLA